MVSERMTTEKDEAEREFEEIKRQLEEDADREIEELKERWGTCCLRLTGSLIQHVCEVRRAYLFIACLQLCPVTAWDPLAATTLCNTVISTLQTSSSATCGLKLRKASPRLHGRTT